MRQSSDSPNGSRSGRLTRRRFLQRAATATTFSAMGLAGCSLTPKTTFSAEKPSRYTLTTEYFTIQSDVQLNRDDPIIRELEDLQKTILSSLQLTRQRDPVTVYLFGDEISYRYYMQSTWTSLPPRRAYFVGTPRELAVYSFISPRMEEDLRHEFTHGVLHACLSNVPLWLDEGLAEYFEVRGSEAGMPHREHLLELHQAAGEGWGPNLFKLELIQDFRNLTRRDYAESWAWVHFLLNTEPAQRELLIQYIAGLRSKEVPPKLLPQIEKSLPNYYPLVKRHVTQLQSAVAIVGTVQAKSDF